MSLLFLDISSAVLSQRSKLSFSFFGVVSSSYHLFSELQLCEKLSLIKINESVCSNMHLELYTEQCGGAETVCRFPGPSEKASNEWR